MSGASTAKAPLSTVSLILGIESCCEVDDMSCNNQFTVMLNINVNDVLITVSQENGSRV